jgi:hypothetical protein
VVWAALPGCLCRHCRVQRVERQLGMEPGRVGAEWLEAAGLELPDSSGGRRSSGLSCWANVAVGLLAVARLRARDGLGQAAAVACGQRRWRWAGLAGEAR